ncbi:hypothetical protein Vadar_004858 [Vaccinium darrowii]|uniref:Uncharacterized protein n=1 Tax=Vaccinium darrowii TaxID=229202 RepID=A0ACB7ZHW8_9ERIC|nr:hypothetical protein Vadar_004858 [Vaccinium darrowii]
MRGVMTSDRAYAHVLYTRTNPVLRVGSSISNPGYAGLAGIFATMGQFIQAYQRSIRINSNMAAVLCVVRAGQARAFARTYPGLIKGSIPPSLFSLSEFLPIKSSSALDALQGNYIHGYVVLDLHSNHLRGEIPIPPVHECYVDYSRKKGLRGAPFIASSKEAEPMSPTLDSRYSHSDEDVINWVYITATLGYIVGFGVIVRPLLY